jgi:hypothetical protein
VIVSSDRRIVDRALMSKWKQFTGRRPRLAGAILWFLAVALTLACIAFQDKTGPTYPLEGRLETAGGPVSFKFLRSENVGTDLSLALIDPVPEGVSAFVEFRRLKSDDDWATLPFRRGDISFTRRGHSQTLSGLGASLPALKERAGKYEFLVFVRAGEGRPESVTGTRPILARYKGAVPGWVLAAHILAIFAAMTIAIRTVLEALVDGKFRGLLWATIVSLLLGGFLLGPLVQWYAFGVWWSGVPFGFDLTDNKVLLELLAWLPAVFLNFGKRRNRASVLLAGAMTLVVYFIPHSLFGSEFDYRSGGGRGTAG